IRETAFHYDRRGNLTSRQVKQGHQQQTTRYGYDANGRLTEIDNGESRLTYRYDALGRLLEETVTHQILDNAATKVSYQYDANGNRIKTGLPSGDDIHYFYYGSGHLSGIKLNHQLISEITRDNLHREIARTQGRITGEYQYNPLGQLTKQAGLTESASIRTLDRTFTYDPNGNLQQSDTTLFTGGQFERDQITYQYDPLGRIEHAHSQGNGKSQHREWFRFDPAHNLIERDNQVIKNNRLSHYAGVGFTYDTFGNTVETAYDTDNRIYYRYDLNDRLVGAEINTRYRKESWIYYYDALGRRIAKARLNKQGEPEIQTTFVWDGSHLVQEIQKGKNSQENDRTFTYIYRHPNSYEPLAQCIDRRDEHGNRIEQEINYFHCDQIGIPREMTDSQGKLIWRGCYDVWGGLHYDRYLAQQNQGHQPFRLQNQYVDQETGLHYNFLRYYEPITGRFMTQDPIGLQGGMNFYRFADNAQGWVDPLGLARFCTRRLRYVPLSTDIDKNFRGGLDLGVFHEHIFFDNGRNIGYTDTGIFSETSMKGYKCSSIHFDDDIMNKAVENVKKQETSYLEKTDDGGLIEKKKLRFGNDNYNMLKNNCQDFATEVEKEYYKIQKLGKLQ
ncbi:RHS repeat-associated core domain-containing protein, partial [Rodentibacter sp. Ppn85]|uniref:RHS repeat-associated core domain-containing protein n=1 Tax=Rodentibacter sp. Ppn85 TaxID=1908525 RepID=UPI00117B9E44